MTAGIARLSERQAWKALTAHHTNVRELHLRKLFAGISPDIYLKPDDKVLVGTTWYAPFVASLRNSFRFTWGGGFIYDRNFAYDRNGIQTN